MVQALLRALTEVGEPSVRMESNASTSASGSPGVNARLHTAAIGQDAVLTLPENDEAARSALRCGEIVVGGTAPGRTTDAVDALPAVYTGAERITSVTATPDVFRADPHAEPLDDRRASRLATHVLDIGSPPGLCIDRPARREEGPTCKRHNRGYRRDPSSAYPHRWPNRQIRGDVPRLVRRRRHDPHWIMTGVNPVENEG